MRNFIILAIILFICSCNQKEKKVDNLQVNQKNTVSIEIFGAPWATSFSATFYADEMFGDSIYFDKCQGDSCITKRIYVTKQEQDTLYSSFNLIQKSFSLEDRGVMVMDGTKVRITIFSNPSRNSNQVSYLFSNLTSVEDAGDEVTRLVSFLNSRLPKDLKMY
ncbi:hypothetical protein [Adhaeribacter soli]|uniref:Uncharacterized protein n=1 Tax=Adhaeribacter soli TaxID=2607655 RepID=A0A5N1IV80_9BACT|nr:hypothetical protein [Adhaeribacter soli]KAA9333677.1 hypothetical protein F0P94_10535 [Adhaeribacter soli]